METPNGTLSPMDEAILEASKRLEESGEGLSFYNMFKAGAEWMSKQLKKK